MRILAAKYQRSLMVEALGAGLQAEDAEEVVQDTLLMTWERARAGTLGPNVGPWLRTVARRRAIDRGRKNRTFHRHQADVLERLELEAPSEISTAVGKAARRKLLVGSVMAELNEADRACLTGVSNGATIDDLADRAESNKNAARQRKFRAIERFRARVTERAEQGDQTAQELLDDTS